MGEATQHLSCPSCEARVPWTVHSSVNATREPDLKLLILQNELGRFRCPHCRAEAFLSQPMLYHDMDLHLMIQLAPQTGFDPAGLNAALDRGGQAGEQLVTRLVVDWNELREKVLLFDAKLDDRPIEVLKALARQQHEAVAGGELFFEELDQDELYFTALVGGQPSSIVIARQMYQTIRMELDRLGLLAEETRWRRIDRMYAAEAIARLAREPAAKA